MFTVEELTVIKNFAGQDRQRIIDTLKKSLPHYSSEETDLSDLATSVIRKLTAIDDKAFQGLDLSQALELED